MPTYSQQNLSDDINGMVRSRFGNVANKQNTRNRAARIVFGELDLRSAQRKASAQPNLFQDIYSYAWPSDGKEKQVIDVQPQGGRKRETEWTLVSQEEFDRKKALNWLLLAFTDTSFTRRLMTSAPISDNSVVISEFDSLTSGGGTWTSFGDALNLVADTNTFLKGNASLSWDISAAGGTTAGVQNTGLNQFDLTNFTSAGAALVWVYIQSTTGITNFKLRIGNDPSNYYEQTVTTTHEGTAFIQGFNLL